MHAPCATVFLPWGPVRALRVVCDHHEAVKGRVYNVDNTLHVALCGSTPEAVMLSVLTAYPEAAKEIVVVYWHGLQCALCLLVQFLASAPRTMLIH